MDFYDRALELKPELVENRRYLHKHAEVGMRLLMTKAYVMEKLKEYGLQPKSCGEGVTAVIGNIRGGNSGNQGEADDGGRRQEKGKEEGKVLLLRADMDALPMKEESGLSFACPTGNAAHTCGHDCHTAMLLTAAKMLKECENELSGTVKFMFQPAEETLEGCKHMVRHGILEDPKVDAALAYHVGAGKLPLGVFLYNGAGTMMYSTCMFRIHIKGKGSHGAYPEKAVDPIKIGTHLYLELQKKIEEEQARGQECILTLGRFEAGAAPNVIPDTAMLEGSIRADKAVMQEHLMRRIRMIAEECARKFGGSVKVEELSSVPPLICDPRMVEEIVGYMKELRIPKSVPMPDIKAAASEDFAVIAEQVPSAFIYLSAGFDDERGEVLAHNPKVMFNEEVLPVGAAYLAYCAVRWLQEHV